MRTVDEERARYTWLTPKRVAEEIGADPREVKKLIQLGRIGARRVR